MMTWRGRFACLALFLGLAGLTTSCGGGGDGSSTNFVSQPSNVGQPRAGLSQAELEAFERGKVVFMKDFKPSEGLGPLYNSTSCRSCHSTPVPGGSSPRYRNFYITAIGPPGLQFPIPGLPSVVVPAYGQGPHLLATFNLQGRRTAIPDTFFGAPVATTQRNAIPIFGVGLFETISDAVIMSNADPDDSDGDGISGRYNTDQGALGRFGVKAQANNIELFTRAPLQNQMGITSNPFQGAAGTVSLRRYGHFNVFQASTNPNDPTTDNDGIPDPEISSQDLGDLIAFTRFLAPPQKRAFGPAETHGEQLFDQVGCTKCHIPSLMGSEGPVEAYTDLLLHDMGPALSDGVSFGVPQLSTIDPVPESSGDEFRTQPLWGVSLTAPYLHDGQADTLVEAIILHGGEADAARQAFLQLSPPDQGDLVLFLEAL